MPKACDEEGDYTEAYEEWIRSLDEDVIQAQYGYEPGEFTVYTSHWIDLYEEGLSPLDAWKRALDGYANARRDAEGRKIGNYARLVAEDDAAVARERAGKY